ncbi:MAG: polyphenol oxidase family protein [Bacilli bacterium]
MEYKHWQRFAKDLIAVTSRRTGGVSKPPYQSLNLAYQVGDEVAAVQENREKFFTSLGLQATELVFTYQSHSTILKKATRADGGRGYYAFDDGLAGDALYTDERNLGLAIYHADCVPIFFYVPTRRLIGVIHAGMTGTLKGVTKLVIKEFCEKEKVNPADIYCYIGPCLTFSHQKITPEQRDEIAARGDEYQAGLKAVGDNLYFDTLLVNVIHLRGCGIPIDHIDHSGECVYELEHQYFSFAREKKTGRMISLIYQK